MSTGDSLFQQIVDHLSTVIWMLDPACEQVEYINPAYMDLSSIDDPRDRDPAELIHPGNPEAAAAWLETISADIDAGTADDEYTLEVQITDEDGSNRWFETTAIPIYEQDTAVGVVGISADITARVEREMRLEEKVQRLEQFASMVSHDIRSPVTSALASLELYEAQGDERHIQEARNALTRVESITADLLQLARNGESALDRETISLEAVVADAWNATETTDTELDIETEMTLDVDRNHLQILLENLFRNAVEHGGEDVTVTVEEHDDGFAVADDGVGIPEEKRETVFTHGSSNGVSGTGIGLAIVERVTDAHGWTVNLTESDSGGARFEFSGVQ